MLSPSHAPELWPPEGQGKEKVNVRGAQKVPWGGQARMAPCGVGRSPEKLPRAEGHPGATALLETACPGLGSTFPHGGRLAGWKEGVQVLSQTC